MEGYSYYLYFKTSPEKKFKLISVDALLLDMIRIEGSDCFIRANYQTIITFCRNLRELEKEAVFTSLMSFVLNNKKCVKDQKTKERLAESFKVQKRLWIAVDGAEPKIKNFDVNAKDFKQKDLHWSREYIRKYSSAAPVITESFISRTLDIANKTKIFEDLTKRQAIYEEENGVYDAMNNARCREDYASYCLQKYIGAADASKEMGLRSNAFYRALGEIGPDGLKDLILQEHLRWNVTYLAEGIEFGPKKDLEGWETGKKHHLG